MENSKDCFQLSQNFNELANIKRNFYKSLATTVHSFDQHTYCCVNNM